ncbi:MAG: T9SS type A sorting domain-containing protein [Bacteroidota bacterium]
MRRISLLVVGLLLSVTTPLASAQRAPDAILPSPDVDFGVDFGRAVAVDGSFAAVGAPGAEEGTKEPGAVTLFERLADGSWAQRQRIVPTDFDAGRFNERERFGAALALDGTRLAVGARGDDLDDTRQVGAVYVYERNPSGTWVEVTKLRDPSPLAFGEFGDAVALDGDRMLVTAKRLSDPATNYEGGTVYVFDRQQNGAWTVSATLTRTEAEGRAFFGDALALDGDRALIGAGGAGSNGRAYVYERAGTVWTEVAEVESPDPTVAGNNKQFGEAVALNGDVALVGANGQGVTYPGLGAFASGAAYVFGRNAGGSWSLRQRLTPGDIDRAELSSSRQIEFGASVALEEGTALVGAPDDVIDGTFGAGSAYVFAETSGTWEQASKLRGSGGDDGERFGTAVAITDGFAVSGAIFAAVGNQEPGAAYVHAIEGPDLPTLSLLVQERIGVTDAPRVLAALQLLVQERIGVTDAPRLLGALRLLVQERLAVSDNGGAARADGSASATAQPIRLDTDLVSFFAPTGLDVAFDNISTPGDLSVFFEAAPPENTEGLPNETIAPYRWVISATDGLAFESASVRFDPDAFASLADPERVTIYRRPDAGTGAFEEVATSVDPVDGSLVGSGLTAFSEFVIAGDGVVVNSEADLPLVFALDGPYPNPATTETTLELALPEAGPIRVEVLDVLGRRVALLAEGEQPAGYVTLRLRTDRLAAGSYFVRLRAGDEETTTRLTVVR